MMRFKLFTRCVGKSGLYFVTLHVFTQSWVPDCNGTGLVPLQQKEYHAALKKIKNRLPLVNKLD